MVDETAIDHCKVVKTTRIVAVLWCIQPPWNLNIIVIIEDTFLFWLQFYIKVCENSGMLTLDIPELKLLKMFIFICINFKLFEGLNWFLVSTQLPISYFQPVKPVFSTTGVLRGQAVHT